LHLGLARAVTLGSKSCRSHDHILLFHLRLTQLGGPGPRIYIAQEQGGPVIPLGTGFPFVASYGSQGYGGGILTRLHTESRIKETVVTLDATCATDPTENVDPSSYIVASHVCRSYRAENTITQLLLYGHYLATIVVYRAISLAGAVVQLLVLLSLHSNGFICHNIYRTGLSRGIAQNCILEVLGLNLGRNTVYPHIGFMWISSGRPDTFWERN
jgi:hypothetical protein